MRATPMPPRRGGPFLIPARTLLLAFGLIAIGLGAFTLFHEFHGHLVDGVYTIVALLLGVIWLVCLALAFIGFRLGVFGAGAIAFIAFGVTASSHFESAPGAMGGFVRLEGLPVAPVAMGLLCACIVSVIIATVAWGTPRGRVRRLDTLPLLLAAVVGAVLVILQATDGVHRDNFGTANTEDGAFAAALTASVWLLGAFWIARLRRVGALIIVLATFIVWYSFVTLHLLKGGTSLSEIASKSGLAWAVFATSAAIVAAASFLVALGLFAVAVVQRRRAKSTPSARAARRASG